MTVERSTSGSPYEARYGFCRALRVGERAYVAGTAPIWPDGECDPDAGVQTRRCFQIALEALREVAPEATVVRTRMFITDARDADAVGQAHAEAFGDAPPVATMLVVAGLLDPRWKVEIELDAVCE
ncbi:MAG: RidA family protein [Planctomycetota bacterium]